MDANNNLGGCLPQTSERFGLAFLICFHILICCVSMIYVSQYHPVFHIFYDPARLSIAIIMILVRLIQGNKAL